MVGASMTSNKTQMRPLELSRGRGAPASGVWLIAPQAEIIRESMATGHEVCCNEKKRVAAIAVKKPKFGG